MGLRGGAGGGHRRPMSDQTDNHDQSLSERGEEPQELPWFTPEPPKPPERYRQEEKLLWVWRIVLVVAMIPAIVLLYDSMGGEVGFVTDSMMEDPDFMPSLQYGLGFLLGAEMVYYFYLSWAFRRFRDWGLVFWGAAGIVVVLGLIFPVG